MNPGTEDPRQAEEISALRATARSLQEELVVLRRRLQDAPTRMRMLEERLTETKGRLAQAIAQNDKLSAVLEEARQQLAVLREEVEKLSAPPNAFGAILGINEDGTVDVMMGGRKLRVNAQPNIEVKQLQVGQEVLLNESMNLIDVRDFEPTGEVAAVKENLGDGRLLVLAHADEERVVELADSMAGQPLRAGDHVRIDSRSGLVLERINRPEVEELVLEEVPDVTYEQVGGLRGQIETIRDAVELPYVHKERFDRYGLEAPKGVLLYGPPGCGKTLIAKAVANSLAKAVANRMGSDDAKSYFLNIKGPELLNKYVGETERQIRLIFQRAKEKSDEGVPVIVFFDEMDSLFRTRGTGISSDVESTIVPQLLSELDGVESLKNVIVIGASNREDLIDPAILRPGRLDVKIKISRPDADAARQIFGIYLGGGHTARRRRGCGCGHQRSVGRQDDRQYGRVDVLDGTRESFPGGHLCQRGPGGALLQGLFERCHDREHRPARQEGRHQAGDRGRAERVAGHGSAGSHQTRVRRTRRPSQHNQSGRLGEDLGQERRADRLRSHADRG